MYVCVAGTKEECHATTPEFIDGILYSTSLNLDIRRHINKACSML